MKAQTDPADQTIKLWDVATGRQLPGMFKGQGDVTAMDLSTDGKTIAAADEFKSINLWSTSSHELIGKLVRHTEYVQAVGFQPGTKILASLDATGTLMFWDTTKMTVVRTMKDVDSFAYSPDGKMLATSSDSVVKIWEPGSGKLIKETPDLRITKHRVVGSGHSGDASSDWLRFIPGSGTACHDSYIGASVAFSPDSKVVFATDTCLYEVYIWDLASNKFSRLKGGGYSAFDDALMINGNTIEQHDNSGKLLRSFSGHVGEVNSALISPDLTIMASGGSDGYIKLWDIRTGREIREFKSNQQLINDLAFTPDGKTIISGSLISRDKRPTLYVLSVGVDHYARKGSPNRYDMHTENDVRQFSGTLQKFGSNAYSQVDAKVVFDREATRAGIVSALQSIIARAKPQDTFVFQFSGQGTTFANQGLLLPIDYDEKALLASSFSLSLLQSLLTKIEARHQLVVIDAGGIDAGFESLVREFKRENSEFEGLVQRDLWMLGPEVGSSLLEITTDDGRKFGQMTYSLLAGLEGGADINNDWAITVRELLDYSLGYTKDLNNQKEKIWSAGGDFVLVRTKPLSGGPQLRSASKLVPGVSYSLQPAYSYASYVPDVKPTPTPTPGLNRSEPVTEAGDAPAKYVRNGKDYALIIGTDNYDKNPEKKKNWPHLNNPVQDAVTIADELKNYYGFEIEQQDVLKDPTKDEVINALRRVKARQYSPDDQLFIFIAGHGYYSEGLTEGFLVFADGAAVDKKDELCGSCQTYMSHTWLRKVLDGLETKHIFLVLDACFGGTFDEKLKRGPEDPGGESVTNLKMIGRIMQFRTRIFLTSGGKEYVPDGQPGHHSPFARRFIEALRGYGGEYGLLTFKGIIGHVERVEPMPMMGEWGSNEPGSNFVFEVRKKP